MLKLVAATCDGWTHVAVDSNLDGAGYPSLALNDGRPALAYGGTGVLGLRDAIRLGPQDWTFEVQ